MDKRDFRSRISAERDNGVAMKIVDGSLRVRSDRTALRYLGDDAPNCATPRASSTPAT